MSCKRYLTSDLFCLWKICNHALAYNMREMFKKLWVLSDEQKIGIE